MARRASCGRCACSTRSACRTRRRSPTTCPGTTSRPARKRACDVDYLMLRGIFMPPGVTPGARRSTTSTFQEGPGDAGVEEVHGERRLQHHVARPARSTPTGSRREEARHVAAHEGGRLHRRQEVAARGPSCSRRRGEAMAKGRRGPRRVRTRRAPSSSSRRFFRARRAGHLRQRAPGHRLGRRRPAGRATSRSTSALIICIASLVKWSRPALAAGREQDLRRRRPAEAGAGGAGPAALYVALVSWIGIYVASVALHRRSSCAGSASTPGGRSPRWASAQWRVLPDLRDLVQGAAAQGAVRSPARAELRWTRSSR